MRGGGGGGRGPQGPCPTPPDPSSEAQWNHVISIFVDEDASRQVRKSGIIGLEVEATGKLFARYIWLKKLQ
jgi:hypothetical protein